ncbi:MAG: hypothetical protein Q8M08_10570 [Bacteroidales bacterium]|nr:hypothetical protein [Bacteroidales bacterium]
MACKNHATNTSILGITANMMPKKGAKRGNPGLYNTLLILVTGTLLIAANAMGQEPIRKAASSSVSATIIGTSQMAEIGSGETESYQFSNGFQQHLSDTIVTTRNLHIITLNCE